MRSGSGALSTRGTNLGGLGANRIVSGKLGMKLAIAPLPDSVSQRHV